MVVFPNCKINLGLRIIRKRADGYHDLETVFHPVPFTDVLEAVKSEKNQPTCTVSGLKVDGPPEKNLCLKAWHLLNAYYKGIPAIDLYLHKIIPMGAGMGGGSADGAFTLILIDQLLHLNTSEDVLASMAIELGSDCPFFLYNKPCLAKGRGEILEPIHLSLKGYHLVLINPGIHINTGWAFSQLQLGKQRIESLTEIINSPVETWKGRLDNDFEQPVFKAFPEIAEIPEILYQQGALFAGMSGSGSTVFGIFQEDTNLKAFFPSNYWIKGTLPL
jgi:4-diphosphocytidyl-2-C-methyl-D-erythritol kinase